MSVKIPSAVNSELTKYTGKCVDHEYLVQGKGDSNFSYEEIFQIMDGYLNRGNAGRVDHNASSYRFIHISEQNSGEGDNLVGSICMKDQGATANRMFADWVDGNCTKILGANAEDKCKALYTTADFYSEKPFWKAALQWIGEKAAGAFEMFVIFGPALYLYHRSQQKKDSKNDSGKGDSSGGDVSGGSVPETAPSTEAVKKLSAVASVGNEANLAEGLLAEAQEYAGSEAVQKDVASVSVVEAPHGAAIPAGHVAVSMNGKLFTMPVAGMNAPALGSAVKVPVFKLSPMRMVPIR